MRFLFQSNAPALEAFRKHWVWFFAVGLTLIALGILAISYSYFASIISIFVLGSLLVIGGVIVIMDTFQAKSSRGSGSFTHLLIGILYFAAGILLIRGPIVGAMSLTLLLAIFYIFVGMLRTVYALSLTVPRKGWHIFNGMISLLIGILILAEWPASGMFIIGLFVGVDLLLCGFIYVLIGLSVRR